MAHSTLIRLACAMAPLFWVTCSSLQTAGVITETTNGATVSGMVAAPDGTPLSGVNVDLRSMESCSACSTSAGRSTMTDANGCYAFDSIDPGTYVVFSVPTRNQALAKTVVVSSDVHTLAVPDSRVKPTTLVSGVVSAIDNDYPITIAVLGTAIKTATDLFGRYAFESMPQAELIYRFSRNNQRIPPLFVPGAMVASSDTFTLDTAVRTLVENFDKGVETNLLYPFLDAGSWYMIAEDSVTVTPASAVADVSAAISPVNAWKGQSLSLSVASTSSRERAILIVLGLNIGKGLGWAKDSQRWFDLSKLTALTFMARGAGTVRVNFLTELIFKQYTGASHFAKTITLSSEWKEYRILASDIAPPEGSVAESDGVTWAQANTRVAEITFFTGDSLSLGLDDIALEGVSLLDLITSGK
jgi:hypothetical protein